MTTDKFGAEVRVGDFVSIGNYSWTGQVWKIAKTGSVMLSGWRGWVGPERITKREPNVPFEVER